MNQRIIKLKNIFYGISINTIFAYFLFLDTHTHKISKLMENKLQIV